MRPVYQNLVILGVIGINTAAHWLGLLSKRAYYVSDAFCYVLLALFVRMHVKHPVTATLAEMLLALTVMNLFDEASQQPQIIEPWEILMGTGIMAIFCYRAVCRWRCPDEDDELPEDSPKSPNKIP